MNTSTAVRELREALGETQQEFGTRFGSVVRTISRWESSRPPSGKVLADMALLSARCGRLDLATVFDRAWLLGRLPELENGGELRGVTGVSVFVSWQEEGM